MKNLILIIILLAPLHLSGQESGFKQNFENFFHMSFEKVKSHVPGISVGVIKNEEVIYLNSLGYANREQGIKVDNKTMYYLASVSKVFTGLLAAQLDHQGQIKLVDDYKSYFSNAPLKDEALNMQQISVQDLLTHTHGIENDPLSMRASGTGFSAYKDLIRVYQNYSTFRGDKKYSYTNMGYYIYGLLLQNHIDKVWQQEIDDNLFKPADIEMITSSPEKINRHKWILASGYVPSPDGNMVPSTLVKKDNTLHPAGGHYASVEALSKWLLIHMNEGEYQGKHIYDAATVRLSKSALAKTEEDTKSQEPYSIEATGLGWRIGKYNDEEIVYMSGSFAGFYAHIAYKPGEKTGVVALANELLIGSRYCNMLAAYVFDWFHYDGAQVEQYAQQLQQFDKIVGGMSGRIKQMYRKINEREWQLELDKEAYTGTYISDAYGELQIVLHKGEFKVTFGNLSTKLTAYEKKNTAPVEFFPFHGELIRFKIENEEVMALTIGDSAYEMKKVK